MPLIAPRSGSNISFGAQRGQVVMHQLTPSLLESKKAGDWTGLKTLSVKDN